MGTEEAAPRSLMELPDACLLAVLRRLAAADPASLASAACAHSRPHQAAVAALGSITATLVSQRQLDSLLLYLDRHGQHVSSLDLTEKDNIWDFDKWATLRQLPTSLVQLSSLHLEGLGLQLQPGGGFQGVVTRGLPLRQLRLNRCTLLDGEEGLAAALSLLPELEHLSVFSAGYHSDFRPAACFSPQVLPQLQQLTYLELICPLVQGPSQPALQPLQALSRLVDLRLGLQNASSQVVKAISADMLSGSPHLTRLDLLCYRVLEPGALAGKTALQHLRLQASDNGACVSAAGTAQLLSHVQHMQQLTRLDFDGSLVADQCDPPAAAFAALTASSKLQALSVGRCVVPAGVWQHVFPAGRQLPHLSSLQLFGVTLPSNGRAPAPAGSRLVSCCPGLQRLTMYSVQYSAADMAQLQGLLALRTLHVDYGTAVSTDAEVQAAGLLTQLRELQLRRHDSRQSAGGLLLHLTQLQQLTRLDYNGPGVLGSVALKTKAPGDEPVWVQIVRRHLDHSDPAVAQQAATALAEWEAHV